MEKPFSAGGPSFRRKVSPNLSSFGGRRRAHSNGGFENKWADPRHSPVVQGFVLILGARQNCFPPKAAAFNFFFPWPRFFRGGRADFGRACDLGIIERAQRT